MTEQAENLILEIFKRIRPDIGDMKQERVDQKMRVNILEGHTQGFMAVQHLTNERLDRTNGRIARIERRPDLVEVR